MNRIPRAIEFMERLPTSVVGKVLKRELKRIMAQEPEQQGLPVFGKRIRKPAGMEVRQLR